MSSRQVLLTLPADPDATTALGRRIGELLRPGDTVALSGSLGAGKTTLVRGLAAGLDIDDPDAVASPTYLLVVEHAGPVPLLHADAYLPQKLEGFLADGGLEYLFDAAKVVAVEWAENVRNLLPERVLWIEIALSAGAGRSVTLRTAAMPPAFSWLQELSTMSGDR